MSYYVRLMAKEDVPQVTDIDREAFPTQWPPANYQHELHNRLAHYIVVCDDEKTADNPVVKTSSGSNSVGRASRLRRLFSRSHFLSNELPPASNHYIVGFIGFWIMADEAHITVIAVREAYRQQGIGELLLISAISLAKELEARVSTLEVRASNTTAQSLYLKYRFIQVGRRRGYYTDNQEDAIVMTTDDITLPSFQTCFQQLKEAHSRKCRLGAIKLAANYSAQPDKQ